MLVCSEVDLQPPPKRQFCGGSQQAIEKMIAFGRELRQMCDQLRLEHGASEANEKALRVRVSGHAGRRVSRRWRSCR